MQRFLRLVLVVLLSSLTACRSNTLEGHYEGTRLDFEQDAGGSYPVALDLEPTGTCVYDGFLWPGQRPCHWERSGDRITVRLTEEETLPGETLPFRLVDGKLAYLKRDGMGGGVCIQLAKNRAISDAAGGLCEGAMRGLPLPPK